MNELAQAYRALQNTLLALPDSIFKQEMTNWLTAKLEAGAWQQTRERLPKPGQLIVKRWKHNGAVWAGVYSGAEKDSAFDEWIELPETNHG